MKVLVTFLIAIQASLVTPFWISPHSGSGCNFDLTALDPEPIVVTTNGYDFIYPVPSSSNGISLSVGQSVLVSCPGGTLTLGGTASGTTVTATCQSGNTLIANGRQFTFTQVVCSRKPVHSARYTGSSCEASGRQIEVGFALSTSIFVRQLTICFDDSNKNTLYSYYNVTRSMEHRETNVPRPSFVEDTFYSLGTKVDTLYTRNLQRTTINALLGLAADSTTYIHATNNFFLARGHLAAKADFVYAPQQDGTFHFVNAAPQWQTFNGGNWQIAEENSRDYAENNLVDLRVYTGTYGVTTLPHATTGRETPLYLYVDSNGNRAIPVPELYWKVVYNPQNKLGVALIGINNPYQQNVTRSIICTDISSQISWLTWKPTNLQSGYSYACAVGDFSSKVSYVPKLDVSGLLR